MHLEKNTILMMNWNFNLLQHKQDQIAEMLIDGSLSKDAYFELDEVYNNAKVLFTISLN